MAMSVRSGRRQTERDTEKRWQQVLAHDRKADGSFFYAVRTTGIVCQPSCPSRRPSRGNVEFFSTLHAALAAGYRTCGRCGPERTAKTAAKQKALAERAAQYLRAHAQQRVSTARLAAAAGIDRLAMMRAFRSVFGVSPAEYARAMRLERFQKKMRRPEMNVTEAIYDAGFGSSSRLYEKSGSTLGMTPREMRNGAPGIEIDFAIVNSPLGRMLVAATAKGICTIAFGDDDTELEATLRNRFPNAVLRAQKRAGGWLAEAIDFIISQTSEHPIAAGFPLDVRATAFQQRVWDALQRIPRGETRTYSGLAAELGAPTATRAVAGACAANPVAIVVPCHRVVGKDGSLTGYRWGTERKKKLLGAESLQFLGR